MLFTQYKFLRKAMSWVLPIIAFLLVYFAVKHFTKSGIESYYSSENNTMKSSLKFQEKKIRKTLPKIIGVKSDGLWLVDVKAQGMTFEYLYTWAVNYKDMSVSELKEISKAFENQIVTGACSNDAMNKDMINGVIYKYTYSSKEDNLPLFKFSVRAGDCLIRKGRKK